MVHPEVHLLGYAGRHIQEVYHPPGYREGIYRGITGYYPPWEA